MRYNIYEVSMNKKLDNLVEIRTGYQPKQKGGIKADPDSNWRIIQISDFDDDLNLNIDDLTMFKPDRDPEPYVVEKGDILFLARGRQNWAFAIEHNIQQTVAVVYFFIFRTKTEKVNPSYLAWYINQTPAQTYLSKLARRGSHMPIIAKRALVDLPVPLPSLDIQQQVAELNRLAQEEKRIVYQLGEKRDELIRAISLKTITKNKKE